MTYEDALEASGILERLAIFDPHLAGTLPLGIAVAGSDLDVLCHAPDALAFSRQLWAHFAGDAGFLLHQWTGGERAVIARFERHGWAFEVFGSPRPVREQAAWRHLEVEARLLRLGGEDLRRSILARRAAGMKTEPAFADLLGLPGNPYETLLALHPRSEQELRELVVNARARSYRVRNTRAASTQRAMRSMSRQPTAPLSAPK